MRPFLIKTSDKENEKDKARNWGFLDRFNYSSNYNDNNCTSIFYKTLNTRKNNSIFKNDYALNDGLKKRKKLDNNYNIVYDIDQLKFNSTETKSLYNDNLIHSSRGNSINNIINSNLFHLSSFSNKNFNGNGFRPLYNEKINYEKVKLFPILKNKRNFKKNNK